MIRQDGNRYSIEGPVTIGTVRAVMDEGASLFNHDGEVVVDMATVNEVDSSAVSLMLEWLREAESRRQQLHFVNIPSNIRSLAAMYGVQELIPES